MAIADTNVPMVGIEQVSNLKTKQELHCNDEELEFEIGVVRRRNAIQGGSSALDSSIIIAKRFKLDASE